MLARRHSLRAQGLWRNLRGQTPFFSPFPLQCSVTYNVGSFLKLPLASFSGFGSVWLDLKYWALRLERAFTKCQSAVPTDSAVCSFVDPEEKEDHRVACYM